MGEKMIYEIFIPANLMSFYECSDLEMILCFKSIG